MTAPLFHLPAGMLLPIPLEPGEEIGRLTYPEFRARQLRVLALASLVPINNLRLRGSDDDRPHGLAANLEPAP